MEYVKRGVKLVLVVRCKEKLEEVVKKCLEYGVFDVVVCFMDVFVFDLCENLVNFIFEIFGRGKFMFLF